MPSFEELLDQIAGGGARAQSTVPTYRDFIQDQAGGRDVARASGTQSFRLPSRPTRPSTRQSGGLSLRELERLVNPRMTEGLQQARSQFQSAQSEAVALGLDDVEGKAPEGLLNSLFGIIDTPRNLAFNSVRTLLDPNMGFEEFTAALDKHEGFGDLAGLEMEEDDSGIERFFKGAGAFLGDVATDPLSYVTFGATSVGRKMGSEAIQKAVARRTASHLSDDVVRRFSNRTFAQQAREQASKLDLSDESLEALQDASKGVDKLDLGRQQLGDAAAEAFQQRGATGLREFLEELGTDGRRLWEDLPTDIKGGLRIRVPFARQEGVRRAVLLAGGGGQLAKEMGLSSLVDSTHKVRNAIRASKASQALSRTFGGANGDLYSKMVADVVQRHSDDLGGVTYSLYRTATEAKRAARLSRKAVLTRGNETLADIQFSLSNAGSTDDVSAATTEFERLVHSPDELYRLRDAAQGLEVDEQGRLFLDLPDEGSRMLTANEVLAMQKAGLYHDTLRDLFRQAVDAGVRVDELNDYYLPRALTEAKREQMQASKVPVAGRRRGTAPDDPRKGREQFVELVAEVDDEGVVRSRLRHLSPVEANERAAERTRLLREAEGQAAGDIETVDFFETDPSVMMSRYMQAMAHITSEAKFAQMIRDAGGVVRGDMQVRPLLRTRPLGESATRLDEAQEAVRQAIDAGQPEQVRNPLRQILADSDSLRDVIGRTINDVSLSPEEQVQRTRTIVETMDAFVDDLPSAKEAGDAMKEARRAFRQAASQAQEAAGRRQQPGDISEAFQSLGLEGLGTRAGEAATRRLPPELDLSYAPEQMRLAINEFYKVADPKTGRTMLDRWYRPYLSMFKITATIGRGPGFHIRNLVGGEWNNHLLGVTTDDRTQMATLNAARVNAGRQARKEVAAEQVAKTGAKRVEVTSGAGFEEAVARRANEILRRRLGEQQVTDDLTLYDVHRLMSEHEVDWRQGEQQAIADVEGAGFGPTGFRQQPEPGFTSEAAVRAARAVGREIDPPRTPRLAPGRTAFPGARNTRARLYPNLSRDEMSLAQVGAQSLANLWWVRFNAGAAEMTESYLRGSAFIRGLKRYGDPETARLLPMASQFDYDDLSEFERKWMRGSLLPFYTFTRSNLGLQLRGLAQQPGKMNQINLLLDNAEEAFGDQDVDYLPEWMRDRFMFPSKFRFDGNPVAFGVETPAQDLNEWFKVGKPQDAAQRMARTLMSATNPVFSVPMQWAAGTEFFTGAPLDETSGRHAPWWYERLPDAIAPTWVNEDGDIMGDARRIVAWEDSLPWLNQSEKLLAIAGLTSPEEGQNRRVSDAVRQLFPVVTAGTVTPQAQAGELYSRAERLRSQARRYGGPEDARLIRLLQEAGFDNAAIAAAMQRIRAQG